MMGSATGYGFMATYRKAVANLIKNLVKVHKPSEKFNKVSLEIETVFGNWCKLCYFNQIFYCAREVICFLHIQSLLKSKISSH